MNNLWRRIILWMLILSTVVFGLYANSSNLHAQTRVKNVVIRDVVADKFPEVTLEFRAIDLQNSALTALSAEDVDVYENNALVNDVEIEQIDRAPIYLVFLVDQGRYFNPPSNTIRESMRYFVSSGYFRGEYDTVTILTRLNDGVDRTETILPPTQSPSQFLAAVNEFDFRNTGQTNGVTGVADSLNSINESVQTGTLSTAVIYIGSIIDNLGGVEAADRQANTAAGIAVEQNSKIHVFHTRASGEYAEPLQTMADGSAGQYVLLERGNDNSEALTNVYDDIVEQSTVYALTYRSASGDSGSRTITVVPRGSQPSSAPSVAKQTYAVSLQNPLLSIEAPKNGVVIERQPQQASDGTQWNYAVDSVNIAAVLQWPDGLPRHISEADLLVDGVREATQSPDITNNRFMISWDIAHIENSSNTYAVQLRLLDEFGQETTSDTIEITVNAVWPTAVAPIVASEPTEAAATIAPTADPCADPNNPNCIANSPATLDTFWLLAIIGGIALAALFFVVIIVILLSRRRKKPKASTTVASPAMAKKTIVAALPQRNAPVLAILRVESGRASLVGTDINIYGNQTTLGRNPQLCDVQLYGEEEASTVSGHHCTIEYDPSQKEFFIIDHQSANGTIVNGADIVSDQRYKLQHQAEIVLGLDGQQGAKLRFYNMVSGGQTAASQQPLVGNETMIDDARHRSHYQANSASDDTIYDDDLPPLPFAPDEEEDDSWLDELS